MNTRAPRRGVNSAKPLPEGHRIGDKRPARQPRLEVRVVEQTGLDDAIYCNIEEASCDGDYLTIAGWVHRQVPSDRPVDHVACYSDQAPRYPLTLVPCHARSDVCTQFRHAPCKSGFRFIVNVDGLSAPFSLHLVPLLEGALDGEFHASPTFYHNSRVIASITVPMKSMAARGRRAQNAGGNGPAPLYVTSLGRSGSTVLAKYFATSKDIFLYGRYPFEARVSAYWLHTMRLLLSPYSSSCSIAREQFADVPWLGVSNPFFESDCPEYSHVVKNTAADARPFLLAAMNTQIAALAASENASKPSPRLFVEKSLPGSLTTATAWEHIVGTKEVILVRDLREWIASLFHFNAKRGNLDVFGISKSVNVRDLADAVFIDARMLVDYVEQSRERAFVLRYEDLIQQSPGVLRALSDYLGVSDLDSSAIGIDIGFDHRTDKVNSSMSRSDDRYIGSLYGSLNERLGYSK